MVTANWPDDRPRRIRGEQDLETQMRDRGVGPCHGADSGDRCVGGWPGRGRLDGRKRRGNDGHGVHRYHGGGSEHPATRPHPPKDRKGAADGSGPKSQVRIPRSISGLVVIRVNACKRTRAVHHGCVRTRHTSHETRSRKWSGRADSGCLALAKCLQTGNKRLPQTFITINKA